MKKLLLSFLSMAAVVFAASAVEPTTIEFTKGSTAYPKNSSYSGTWASNDGFWSFGAFNNNNAGWSFIAAGWKSDATKPFFATAKPSEAPIANIVATIGDRYTKTAVTKVTLYVADNDAFVDAATTDITSLLPDAKNTDMTIAVDGTVAGQFVKVELEIPKQSSNGQAFSLSKIVINYAEVAGDKQPAGLSYSASSVEVNANALDKFEAPTLSNPNNLAVIYSSSDENVAEVTTEGVVTLTGDEGVAVIKAEFAGDDKFNAGIASYTITVKNAPVNESSEANPYSVAQALAIAKSLDATTKIADVYAKGYVIAIKEIETKDYGNATYTIADAADATEGLSVYRGYYLNGEKFTAADQLKVGAEVVVCGTLVNYNGNTPQFTSGSKLISYTYDGGDTPVDPDPEEVKVSSVAETIALATNTEVTVDYELTVAFVNFANLFACDAEGKFIQVYKKGYNSEFNVGDVIPAGWKAKYILYSDVTPELEPLETPLPTPTAGTFEPKAVPAADITTALVNNVIKIENVVFDAATPDTKDNFTGKVGDIELSFRNNYTKPGVEAGTYDVTVVVTVYNKVPSLYVINFEKKSTSAIDEIAVDQEADAVYYNLQGVRVDNPANGVYVRVAGSKVSKVYVR